VVVQDIRKSMAIGLDFPISFFSNRLVPLSGSIRLSIKIIMYMIDILLKTYYVSYDIISQKKMALSKNDKK